MKTKDPCNLGRPKAIANGANPKDIDKLFAPKKRDTGTKAFQIDNLFAPRKRDTRSKTKIAEAETFRLRQRYLTGH